MQLKYVAIPENPSTTHLTQIYVMMFVELNNWFKLPEVATEVSGTQNCEGIQVYENVKAALLKMRCVNHENNLLQKTFDPDDPPTRDMTPDTCQSCHLNSSRTEGCLILQAHQRRLSRERF